MRFDLLIFEGVDELDVIGPLEVLRSANRFGADFDVRLVTLTDDVQITGAFGTRITADERYEGGADVVLVPGGGYVGNAPAGVTAEIRHGEWVKPLETALANGATVVGVCTGTMLLANAGLLEGRRVSTHHGARTDLAGLGAHVLDDRVVDDGNIVTSGGVTAGIDCALWLIERFASKAMADQAAERMEYARERPIGA